MIEQMLTQIIVGAALCVGVVAGLTTTMIGVKKGWDGFLLLFLSPLVSLGFFGLVAVIIGSYYDAVRVGG